MQTGCKCTAREWNSNSLQSLWSLFVETALNCWTAILTAPAVSISLTLIQWHVEFPKFISRRKMSAVYISAKATRLEWSLWKTEISFLYVFYQPCFTVPQLLPFWDKWHSELFMQVRRAKTAAGEGRWAGSFCRSFCQCQDNSCKITGFDFWTGSKQGIPVLALSTSFTQSASLQTVLPKDRLNAFCSQAAVSNHLTTNVGSQLKTWWVRITADSPARTVARGGMSAKGENEGSHPAATAALEECNKVCKC